MQNLFEEIDEQEEALLKEGKIPKAVRIGKDFYGDMLPKLPAAHLTSIGSILEIVLVDGDGIEVY